ncbi:MAG: helix-turn-helix domain-containing protein [Hyphomonadaceae bacterium]
MLKVTVVLLGDGLASTALGPLEVFFAAGMLFQTLKGETPKPLFEVTTASIDGKGVSAAYGLGLTPQNSIDDIERTDIIIVPTSGTEVDLKLVENSALLPWLRKHHALGAYIAGTCMGSVYLAEAGLLDGREATTHWASADDFARRYPRVKWRPELFVTEDARLLCSGGVTSAIDVSLYLVEKLVGHDFAVQTAKALLHPMPRLSQSGYAVLPFSPPHEDARIRKVESHIQRHFRDDLCVDDLAERFGMSGRTLLRRFKAATGRLPGAYVQAVRVEMAKAILERERTSVQSVASAVGYEDVSFFRSIFKRCTGMTPGEYRSHFGKQNIRAQEAREQPI